MAECEVCGSTLRMEYTCERCDGTYCSEHRLPETHDCPPVPTGGSERWFSEKFENTDETRRRSHTSEHTSAEDASSSPPDTGKAGIEGNPSGRSTPNYDGDTPARGEKAPSSKPAPTSSGPDVNPDGSIDRGSQTAVQINSSKSAPDSTLSRRGWTIILLVLLVPLAVGASTLVMDPGTVTGGAGDTAPASDPTATATPVADSSQSPASQAGASEDDVNVTAIRLAVHNRVNQVRTERDLEALEYHDRTAESAQEHAERMAETGKFEHSGENQYLCRAGENIAYTYAYGDIETGNGTIVNHRGNETSIGYGLVRSWMNSEKGHRENLLDDDNKFQGIGIAIRESSDGPRVYAVQALCKS
jgi:uncharacterized protein YkwD